MKIDLTKIYKKYKGLWVALDKNLKMVISADKNMQKAYNKALQQGHKKPTMFKVPQNNLPYFGLFFGHEA